MLGTLLTACCTNAVVAICVVLSHAVGVGAAGIPVKVGEAILAFPDISVIVLASSILQEDNVVSEFLAKTLVPHPSTNWIITTFV